MKTNKEIGQLIDDIIVSAVENDDPKFAFNLLKEELQKSREEVCWIFTHTIRKCQEVGIINNEQREYIDRTFIDILESSKDEKSAGKGRLQKNNTKLTTAPRHNFETVLDVQPEHRKKCKSTTTKLYDEYINDKNILVRYLECIRCKNIVLRMEKRATLRSTGDRK